MIGTFWTEIGKQLAGSWISKIFTPAFLFWGGGFAILANRNRTQVFIDWWDNMQGDIERVIWLVIILLGIAASAAIVSRLERSIIRLLEGYWYNWWGLNALRTWLISRQLQQRAVKESRIQQLAKIGLEKLSLDERREYVKLDLQLSQMPINEKDMMPTRLGNILKAAETSSYQKYGLEAIICWPRLWMIMPDSARKDLSASREELNGSVHLLFWGALFIIWGMYRWWAILISILVTLIAHQNALRAAKNYGILIESVFDLYRPLLYEALRWPLPSNPSEDRQMGLLITEYLWRGSDLDLPEFTQPKKS